MTAHAQAMRLPRGACPGLSAPMPTGDGLLVRLQPVGTVSLSAFAALCVTARRHGNGIIEVTSRGNIQIRGLGAQSAPRFASDIAALNIAAADGVPVHCNALAGIGADEIFDAEALAVALRHVLIQRKLAARLSPKVSVAVDGGGTPGLAMPSADIRLCAREGNGGIALRVAVAGNAGAAVALGNVELSDGVEAVVRLLEVVAQRGRQCRARDIIAAAFHEALTSCPHLLRASTSFDSNKEKDVDGRDKPGHDAIGNHPLRNGAFACGVGLAFGHSNATALEQLIEAAGAAGVGGFRAAPGRALLAIGVARESASRFTNAAEKLGFISRANDPRRRVVACAGAPICGAAHIAARAMAPAIAAAIAPFHDDAATIHISGCAKGCAHAGPAALTVVGTPYDCVLVAAGTADDAPFARVAAKDLTAAVTRFARTRASEDKHV